MGGLFKFFRRSEFSLMKNVCRWLLVLVAAGLLLISSDKSIVLAQSDNETSENATIGFKGAHVWLYPEYDDPRLLVMLEGKIDGAEPPVKLSFLVPSAAEMYSAGSMNTENGYSGGPPDREPSAIPGWDEISYEVTTDTFRVEYYDPIIRGAPDKSIDYQFRTLYPIADLGVVVQQPLKATNFSVVPRGDPFTDNLGFASYSYDYANITAEDTLEFSIAYTKSDPGTSVPPITQETGPTFNSDIIVAVLVAIAVSGVLVGGLWFLMRAKKGQDRGGARRPAAGGRGRASGNTVNKGGAGQFCTNCGQRLEKSIKFCPDCGTKVS